MDNTVPTPAEPAAKARRRPVSFVRRLTTSQFFQSLRLLILVDVLIAVLFAGLLAAEQERTAIRLLALSPQQLADYQVWHPELTVQELHNSRSQRHQPADDTFGRQDDYPLPWDQVVGISVDSRIEDRLGLAPGALRTFWFVSTPGEAFVWDVELRPEYRLTFYTDQVGVFQCFTFDLSARMAPFCWAMAIVGGAEILWLIGSTSHFRRAAKKTLAPIQQLTAATQSISAEPAPTRSSKHISLGEKELSGTIDTLNRITAKKLDTRISVGDERAELRGLAGAINSMLDRLDAAYSSQLRFVSDASHELRTPIAVIQGYANLLDRWGKEDPAALQESIDAIRSEAEGMKVLVEDLLFLARSDNNSITMEIDPLDVSALAEEVLRDTQVIDQSHEFSTQIQPGLWTVGDSGLLKQALRIFMDNAVKYTPAGGKIKVSTQVSGEWVQVSVTDQGIGIPEQDLPHVFERFYRSDESRARATGGTGLGLSIAKWTIQRHGGHLEIISRQDIGTRLTMALPQAQPAAANPEEDNFDTAL